MKRSDIDVERGYYDTDKSGGQMATIVPMNKKCAGCLHYETNRTACMKALAPKSCGSGSDPEQGYAPMMPDAQAYQEWRQKKGMKFTTPPAQAGKKDKNKGPSYSVHVLGDHAGTLSLHKSEWTNKQWYDSGLYPEIRKALELDRNSRNQGRSFGAPQHPLGESNFDMLGGAAPKLGAPGSAATSRAQAPAGETSQIVSKRKLANLPLAPNAKQKSGVASGAGVQKPAGEVEAHPMADVANNWSKHPSGRTHSIEVGHGKYTVLHHDDGTHTSFYQAKGAEKPVKLAGHPDGHDAIGAVIAHHDKVSSAANPSVGRTSGIAAGKLQRSMVTGLMFFQSDSDDFSATLSKALSSEPMKSRGRFAYAIPSDHFDAGSYYTFDAANKSAFYTRDGSVEFIGKSDNFIEAAMAHHRLTVESDRTIMMKGFVAEAVALYHDVNKAMDAAVGVNPKLRNRRTPQPNAPTLRSTTAHGEYHVHPGSKNNHSIVSFKPHDGGQVDHPLGHNEHGIPREVPNEQVGSVIAGHSLGQHLSNIALGSNASPGSVHSADQKVASVRIGVGALMKAARIVVKAALAEDNN